MCAAQAAHRYSSSTLCKRHLGTKAGWLWWWVVGFELACTGLGVIGVSPMVWILEDLEDNTLLLFITFSLISSKPTTEGSEPSGEVPADAAPSWSHLRDGSPLLALPHSPSFANITSPSARAYQPSSVRACDMIVASPSLRFWRAKSSSMMPTGSSPAARICVLRFVATPSAMVNTPVKCVAPPDPRPNAQCSSRKVESMPRNSQLWREVRGLRQESGFLILSSG